MKRQKRLLPALSVLCLIAAATPVMALCWTNGPGSCPTDSQSPYYGYYTSDAGAACNTVCSSSCATVCHITPFNNQADVCIPAATGVRYQVCDNDSGHTDSWCFDVDTCQNNGHTNCETLWRCATNLSLRAYTAHDFGPEMTCP